MAVSKENERRCERTERIPFADCHAAVGKGFSYFFITEFFADCLYWQVAKALLIFFKTKILCRRPLLAGGKELFANCFY